MFLIIPGTFKYGPVAEFVFLYFCGRSAGELLNKIDIPGNHKVGHRLTAMCKHLFCRECVSLFGNHKYSNFVFADVGRIGNSGNLRNSLVFADSGLDSRINSVALAAAIGSISGVSCC